jgi:hypothetical protein
MFTYETLWDVYEIKFVIFFVSVVGAIWLGNWLYNKSKDKNKDD